jgi:hypothetical protein
MKVVPFIRMALGGRKWRAIQPGSFASDNRRLGGWVCTGSVEGGYLPLHVMISLLPPRLSHRYLSGVISAQGQYMGFEVHTKTKNFGDLDRGWTVRSSNNGWGKRLFCSPNRPDRL